MTIDTSVSEKYQAKAWREGAFVMLHPMCYMADDKLHPDAGRIGQISSISDGRMVVLFENDDLIGKSTFCMLPKDAWMPMPEFMVESYSRKAGVTAWRMNPRGLKIARDMGWNYTAQSEGLL